MSLNLRPQPNRVTPTTSSSITRVYAYVRQTREFQQPFHDDHHHWIEGNRVRAQIYDLQQLMIHRVLLQRSATPRVKMMGASCFKLTHILSLPSSVTARANFSPFLVVFLRMFFRGWLIRTLTFMKCNQFDPDKGGKLQSIWPGDDSLVLHSSSNASSFASFHNLALCLMLLFFC